jgi:hypothetical protein
VCGNSAPVIRLVLFPSTNQLSISTRSYVYPSVVITGSCITSIVNGQWKNPYNLVSVDSCKECRTECCESYMGKQSWYQTWCQGSRSGMTCNPDTNLVWFQITHIYSNRLKLFVSPCPGQGRVTCHTESFPVFSKKF